MLAVGVDLHRDVVAVAQRVAVAGAHGAADAEVEGQPAHQRAGGRGPLGGGVAGAVVDDEDVDAGQAARISVTVAPTASCSFHAGTITSTRAGAAASAAGLVVMVPNSSCSRTAGDRGPTDRAPAV